jgi:hypothetical protein
MQFAQTEREQVSRLRHHHRTQSCDPGMRRQNHGVSGERPE